MAVDMRMYMRFLAQSSEALAKTRQVRQEIERLQNTQASGAKKVSRAAVDAGKAQEQAAARITQKQQEINQAYLKTALVAGVVASGFALVGKKVADTISQVELAQLTFQSFTGSATLAKERYEELLQFAASTPLQIEEIVSGTTTMLAFGMATMDTAQAMDDLKHKMLLFGLAAKAAQVPGGATQIVRALNDLKSGVVEIRQLSAIGLSREALGAQGVKFEKSGGLASSGAEAFAAGLRILEQRFGVLAANTEDLLATRISNIKDKIFIMLKEIGEPLMGDLKALIITVVDYITRAGTAAKDSGEMIRTTLGAAGAMLAPVWGPVVLIFKGFLALAERAPAVLSSLAVAITAVTTAWLYNQAATALAATNTGKAVAAVAGYTAAFGKAGMLYSLGSIFGAAGKGALALAGSLGGVVTIAAGLAYGIYKLGEALGKSFVKGTLDACAASRKLQDELSQQAKRMDELAQKADALPSGSQMTTTEEGRVLQVQISREIDLHKEAAEAVGLHKTELGYFDDTLGRVIKTQGEWASALRRLGEQVGTVDKIAEAKREAEMAGKALKDLRANWQAYLHAQSQGSNILTAGIALHTKYVALLKQEEDSYKNLDALMKPYLQYLRDIHDAKALAPRGTVQDRFLAELRARIGTDTVRLGGALDNACVALISSALQGANAIDAYTESCNRSSKAMKSLTEILDEAGAVMVAPGEAGYGDVVMRRGGPTGFSHVGGVSRREGNKFWMIDDEGKNAKVAEHGPYNLSDDYAFWRLAGGTAPMPYDYDAWKSYREKIQNEEDDAEKKRLEGLKKEYDNALRDLELAAKTAQLTQDEHQKLAEELKFESDKLELMKKYADVTDANGKVAKQGVFDERDIKEQILAAAQAQVKVQEDINEQSRERWKLDVEWLNDRIAERKQMQEDMDEIYSDFGAQLQRGFEADDAKRAHQRTMEGFIPYSPEERLQNEKKRLQARKEQATMLGEQWTAAATAAEISPEVIARIQAIWNGIAQETGNQLEVTEAELAEIHKQFYRGLRLTIHQGIQNLANSVLNGDINSALTSLFTSLSNQISAKIADANDRGPWGEVGGSLLGGLFSLGVGLLGKALGLGKKDKPVDVFVRNDYINTRWDKEQMSWILPRNAWMRGDVTFNMNMEGISINQGSSSANQVSRQVSRQIERTLRRGLMKVGAGA